jgi:hypothetical protein
MAAARPRSGFQPGGSKYGRPDGSICAPYGEPVSTSIADGGVEFTIIASEFA